MKSIIPWVLLLSLSGRTSFAAPPTAELIEVNKIWDQPPHSAFTDLAFWNRQFVCAFREGRGHVSADGKIRVLTSPDGREWQSAALVDLAGYDLRDAGLSISARWPANAHRRRGTAQKGRWKRATGTFVSFSNNATTWTEPADRPRAGPLVVAHHVARRQGLRRCRMPPGPGIRSAR